MGQIDQLKSISVASQVHFDEWLEGSIQALSIGQIDLCKNYLY